MPQPFEDHLDYFLSHFEGVESENGHFRAMCPIHEGERPALVIEAAGENGSKKLLVHCHAGCDYREVLNAAGLSERDLFPPKKNTGRLGPIVAAYDYMDASGDTLFQVIRYDPKDFRQRRPDGRGGWVWNVKGLEPVLFKLPDVLRAIMRGDTVYLCEGEKDALNAKDRLGVTATTAPMGAKHWRDSYTQTLRGAHVVLLPDNDGPGKAHMLTVARNLAGVAKSVKVAELPDIPDGGDLTDWLDAGGTAETLDALVAGTPPFDSGLFDRPIGSEFGQKENRGGAGTPLPVKTAEEVLTESGEKPEWVIEGFLVRGGITDLSGLAKYSGKTTFMLHGCASLIRGSDFLGYKTKQTKVLYLTEQGNNFSEALRKAGLDDSDAAGSFFILQQKDLMGVAWADLIKEAVEYCKAHDIEVLVVDTFASMAGIVGSEENNSGYIREKMEALKAAAQSHNLAVAYLRHAGKRGDARGSSQFEAEGDIILTLKRPEGNQAENVRVLEGIGRYDDVPRKLNIELTDTGYATLGSDTKIEFSKAIQAIKSAAPRTREEAVQEGTLLEAANAKDVTRTTLRRAIAWLVDQGTLQKLGRGVRNDPVKYWYTVPDPPSSKQRNVSDQTMSPKAGEKENKSKRGGSEKVVPLFPQDAQSEADAVHGKVITDGEGVERVVKELSTVSEVALDLETTGLSPIENKVRLISLQAGEQIFLVDCFAVDPKAVIEALKGKTVYAHGSEFDLPFLHHAYGFFDPATVDVIDTLHLSQVARAGEWSRKEDGSGWEREKHSLKHALQRELGITLGDKNKYQRGKAWTGELTLEHVQYAAGDVAHLKELADKLLGLIEERGLEEVWSLEKRTKPLFIDMCCRGIPFDEERWQTQVNELEEQVSNLKEVADKLAPDHPEEGSWNWHSPQQVIQALALAGVEVKDARRETLAKLDHPLVKAVADYRDTHNLLSRVRTWGSGRYRSGRVYPHWNPAGAATGRSSCTDPNVQSLPKGDFRQCIKPTDGRALVKADLNQIELRVLAAITEDETMLGVFADGGDLHLTTAEAITGREVKKGDPERQLAKSVNFGLSFGMGAKRFKDYARDNYGVNMTLAEAKEAKKKLLDAYPGIDRWHAEESSRCQAGEFETRTLLGRRRVVEPGYDGGPSFTERLNAPVQGTAADILKLALAKLWEGREGYPDVVPILSVHDEIVLEGPEENAEAVKAWLGETLQEAVLTVLGRPELAGADCVETEVIPSWGGL